MTRAPRRVAVQTSTLHGYPPTFELPDQHFNLVKLERYLGRQPLIVCFFDGTGPLEEDRWLAWLRDHYDAIESAGYEVIGVSTAKPAEVRRAASQTGKPWPFPILTDMNLRSPEPAPAHHAWGLVDPQSGALRSGLFLIDRKGYVEYSGNVPVAVDHPEQVLKKRFLSPE